MSHTDGPLLSTLGPADARQAELVERALRHTQGLDGLHATGIGGLHFARASSPSQPLPTVYEPGLSVVLQGSKHAALGGEIYRYDPLNYLVISVTLPIHGQIIEASPERPYLCARLSLQPGEIGELMLQADAHTPHAMPVPAHRGLQLARVSETLLDALLRLVRLLDAPADAAVLAPLALREISYRVLTGELGPRLRDLATVDSHAHRIARAIELIKRRFDEPLRIEDMADAAHMSASSLHHHFKQVTAMSPLQFQKQLRLHRARQMMLAEGLDAAAAGHRVGYESPSQFSREYRRLFGAPPRAEIDQLRARAQAPAPAPTPAHVSPAH